MRYFYPCLLGALLAGTVLADDVKQQAQQAPQQHPPVQQQKQAPKQVTLPVLVQKHLEHVEARLSHAEHKLDVVLKDCAVPVKATVAKKAPEKGKH